LRDIRFLFAITILARRTMFVNVDFNLKYRRREKFREDFSYRN